MNDEWDLEAVMVVAEEMLVVGAEQLKLYDPAKEDPRLAVARIYYAMDAVREAVETELLVAGPVDKKHLN